VRKFKESSQKQTENSNQRMGDIAKYLQQLSKNVAKILDSLAQNKIENSDVFKVN
jgi:hypothetical protein